MFWNGVEQQNKRGDAVVSREVEVALPDELSEGERRMLAIGFARELVERYKVAADVAIHAPSREGDERNHHAHIMLSACVVAQDGTLGKKPGELDPSFCQKHRMPNMADRERVRWAELTNIARASAFYEKYGFTPLPSNPLASYCLSQVCRLNIGGVVLRTCYLSSDHWTTTTRHLLNLTRQWHFSYLGPWQLS